MAMIDTAFADGMAHMSDLIEGGMAHRDAAAKMFEENKRVIFCGNGYSAEWPVEAEKRGLPNLKDSVQAADQFATAKSKELFTRTGVFTEAEVDARQECLYENYATVLEIEATTLVQMVRQDIEPAMAEDLALYYQAGGTPYNRRKDAYAAVTEQNDILEGLLAKVPADEPKEAAHYCAETLKPQLTEVRKVVDAAELLVKTSLWPYPSYTEICFSHHMSHAL